MWFIVLISLLFLARVGKLRTRCTLHQCVMQPRKLYWLRCSGSWLVPPLTDAASAQPWKQNVGDCVRVADTRADFSFTTSDLLNSGAQCFLNVRLRISGALVFVVAEVVAFVMQKWLIVICCFIVNLYFLLWVPSDNWYFLNNWGYVLVILYINT